MSNQEMTLLHPEEAISAESIDAEMQSLRRMMAEPGSDYWHGLAASMYQRRFRELADLKAKQSNEEHR